MRIWTSFVLLLAYSLFQMAWVCSPTEYQSEWEHLEQFNAFKKLFFNKVCKKGYFPSPLSADTVQHKL